MIDLVPNSTLAVLLHEPQGTGALSALYERAFSKAVELHLVTAFLTEWDSSLRLAPACEAVRIVVGKDFGITRKAACRDALKWAERQGKTRFRVATEITGFHPKLVLWKEKDGGLFMIVGSSNLTRAAFASNFEANVHLSIDEACFRRTRDWIDKIDDRCRDVTSQWIDDYSEAKRGGAGNAGSRRRKATEVEVLILPSSPPLANLLRTRRSQIQVYRSKAAGLLELFRSCAAGTVSSAGFYEKLKDFWSYDVGDRLQGHGWEIKGKRANFRELAQAFVAIVDAKNSDRDDEVVRQIDDLDASGNPARGAFFSEMLCLKFPDRYPILNEPIHAYLRHVKFKARPNASQGEWYIDLTHSLRRGLKAAGKNYPAKTLCELDSVIESYVKREVAKPTA